MRARVRERTCDVIKGRVGRAKGLSVMGIQGLSWPHSPSFCHSPENAGLLACGRVRAEGRSGAG